MKKVYLGKQKIVKLEYVKATKERGKSHFGFSKMDVKKLNTMILLKLTLYQISSRQFNCKDRTSISNQSKFRTNSPPDPRSDAAFY